VHDVALEVPTGSVFGFLGPNGSGKTTTIRMLLGLAGPTSGTISVLGYSIPREAEKALPRVGALVRDQPFILTFPARTTSNGWIQQIGFPILRPERNG